MQCYDDLSLGGLSLYLSMKLISYSYGLGSVLAALVEFDSLLSVVEKYY
jgi:hypothetical protein